MAGIKPGLVSGANAKIQIDLGGTEGAKTIAYATDVSYNIDAVTVPIEVIGQYEVLTNEPIAYGVNGSFSVVRYTHNTASSNIKASWETSSTDNAPVSMGFSKHVDPAQLLQSTTFDMSIFQKTSHAGDQNLTTPLIKLSDCRIVQRDAVLNKRGVLVDMYRFVGILCTENIDGQGATT